MTSMTICTNAVIRRTENVSISPSDDPLKRMTRNIHKDDKYKIQN